LVESFVRDIGLIGKKNGWTVTFGGNASNRAKIGNVIGTDLADKVGIELLNRFIDYYSTTAKRKRGLHVLCNVLESKNLNSKFSKSIHGHYHHIKQLFNYRYLNI